VPFRTLGLAFRKTSPRKVLFEQLAGAFAEIAHSRVAA